MRSLSTLPPRPTTHSVLLLLMSVHCLPVHATNCTQDQTNQMQAQFTDCTGQVTSKYQSSLESWNKEEATCVLFNNLVNDCGKIWQLCHSDHDIRKMKNMQLEALVGQYVDSGLVTLEDCNLVNEYWDTEKAEEEEGSGSGSCTDRQYIQTQTKFQTCSHTISSQVYQSFHEIADPAQIAGAVCNALNNISSSCPHLLKECFAKGDVKQMVNMHIQEIKKYLVALATLKIDESVLDSCVALEKSEVGDPAYEYEEEEYSEEPAQGGGPETGADITQNIQELLTEHKAQEPADQPEKNDQWQDSKQEQRQDSKPDKAADNGNTYVHDEISKKTKMVEHKNTAEERAEKQVVKQAEISQKGVDRHQTGSGQSRQTDSVVSTLVTLTLLLNILS